MTAFRSAAIPGQSGPLISKRLIAGALALVASSLCSIGLAHAQQFDEQKVAAAAKSEGSLTLYASWSDPQVKALADAFSKKYPGIKVNSLRLVSATLFSRFTGEVQSGVVQADVLQAGSSALFQQQPDLFVQISPEATPNVKGLKIKAKSSSYFVVFVDPHVITYNNKVITPDDLKKHLQSWKDLADPYWKGKITLLDPLASTAYMSWYRTMRMAYGDDWLKALAANNGGFASSGTPASQQVAAGAYLIAAPTAENQSAEIRANGAPISILDPSGPSHDLESSMAVPKKAPHPNAALLFVNWMMTPEAQEIGCKVGGLVPVVDGLPASCPKLSPEHVGAVDVIADAEQKEILSLLGKK